MCRAEQNFSYLSWTAVRQTFQKNSQSCLLAPITVYYFLSWLGSDLCGIPHSAFQIPHSATFFIPLPAFRAFKIYNFSAFRMRNYSSVQLWFSCVRNKMTFFIPLCRVGSLYQQPWVEKRRVKLNGLISACFLNTNYLKLYKVELYTITLALLIVNYKNSCRCVRFPLISPDGAFIRLLVVICEQLDAN